MLSIGIFAILQYLTSGTGQFILCLVSVGFLWRLSIQDKATRFVDGTVANTAICIVFAIRLFYMHRYGLNAILIYLFETIILFVIFKFLSKHLKGKLGEGDFDAAHIIILCVGFEGFLYTYMIGCFLVIFKYIPLIFTKFRSLKSKSVPFIPYLYMGYVAVLLLWKEMIAV